ncbi:YhgE/Pip family protein [Pueribacillus sp. YX66]|uniref:YhgE/Pip family protein n=1 Tax=Pueribacillus sp. YX66 TaxID=3229242 RepID=UPI00358D8E71
MKNIFSIYKHDLQLIFTNWATAVIVFGLIFLPSLYAWFNIKASWDPYGNTNQLKIAVTNNDVGANVFGEQIHIGNEVVNALKTNKKLGWTFVDNEKEGHDGVMHGNYYASLVIPQDFSEKIASVVTDNPTKPEIIYTVNEKINAIAPKITSTGASNVVDEISSNFVKVASETIFKVMNELGLELKKELPSIKRVRDFIFKLEKRFPELEQVINSGLNDAIKAEKIVSDAQNYLPIVTEMAQNGAELTDNITEFLERGQQLSETIAPNVKQDMLLLEQAAHTANNVTSEVEPTFIEQTRTRIQTGITVSNNLIALFTRINNLSEANVLSEEINHLQEVNTLLSEQVKALDSNIQLSVEKTDQTVGIIEKMLNRFDNEIEPKLAQGIMKAQQSAEKAEKMLTGINEAIPDVQKILTDASKGLEIGKDEIETIKQSLPATKAKITDLADEIRKFEKEADIDEIIALLVNDYEKESDFFANPIVLTEHKLFPIPNYGSAMSPFFTALSLWVGALLLVSLITVNVHDEHQHYTSTDVYFGRFFTFLTIALLQSVIVTLGDLYLLKTYVANPLLFVLFGLFLSATFMLIVYTFVTIFNNVGKALAIILLVLQIAGSGGTFPIQLTPPFFQAIYPLLPFTYAISLLREAVGGVLWDLVLKDFAMLTVFIVSTLLLGLLLKEPINKLSAPLKRKAKSGKLIH